MGGGGEDTGEVLGKERCPIMQCPYEYATNIYDYNTLIRIIIIEGRSME